MASRALPPRKKKSRQPAPTTILALSDDLLREVFLRLPSLPSLVRAALACPAFLRAVRSSPAFRRRFRDLHSPSIFGTFLINGESRMPTFAPIRLRRGRRSDPDHDAALRGLDVFLTRLPDAICNKKVDGEDAKDEDVEDIEVEDEDDDEEDIEVEDDDDEEGPEWSMSGCSDGYVVLVRPRWNTKKVAVYDPLTGALHLFPGPPDEVFSGKSENTEAEFHVIPSETDDRSFCVLCIPMEFRGELIAILPLGNREWQITPTAGRLRDATNVTLVGNGLVYWVCAGEDYIPVLNTATLQFSTIDLPTGLSGAHEAGETKDGKICLADVSDDYDELDVWVRRTGDDGVDKWVHDMTFQILDAIDELDLGFMDEDLVLDVVSISRGIVYLSIHPNELRKDEIPSWLLSFCLETRELQKLCRITGADFFYPYIMAWPPSLVRNEVRAD